MPLDTTRLVFRPNLPATGYLVIRHVRNGFFAYPSLNREACARQMAAMPAHKGWSGGRFYHSVKVETAVRCRIKFSARDDQRDLAGWIAAGYEILRNAKRVRNESLANV